MLSEGTIIKWRRVWCTPLFHRLLQKILRWVPCGVFLHYLLNFEPLHDFFPSKPWLQISLCLWRKCVCQYTHWIKISFKLSLALFISAIFWKMGGWVAIKFFFFMLKFKSFKMWRPKCLFILLRFLLSVWKVISYTERNVLWNVLIVDHQVKKILYIFSRTVRKVL